MRYSIITPSIARTTLFKLCDSIDTQSYRDFEHLVRIDIPRNELTAIETNMLNTLSRPWRKFSCCDKRHMNTGNTCRHQVTEEAQGDYIFYIDDDDFFPDNQVLEYMKCVTSDWAIFPVDVCGVRFFNNPPGMCRITTGGFLLRRGLIDWPDVPNYETDGMIVEELLRRGVPYQSFPDRSVASHPAWNVGRMV